MNNDLAQRLRTYREAHGLSLEDVATAIDRVPAIVDAIENETIRPGPTTIANIERLITSAPAPTPFEAALLTLLRTATEGGWDIVIRRGCIANGSAMLNRIEEDKNEHSEC